MAAVIKDDFWEEIAGRLYGPHDIDEITRYPFDWSEWLASEGVGVTIVGALALYEAPMAQPAGKPIQFDTEHATVWATGGTDGKTLRLTCRITASNGSVQDRSVYLRCETR